MGDSICNIPVSIGELFDKYTILQIKQNRITDAYKISMVEKEIEYLTPFIEKYNLEETLLNELKRINETLWDVEDKLREKERENIFDAEFVQLARSVYITNDKRSETKNKINAKTNSGLIDIKSYVKYNNSNNDSNNEIINLSASQDDNIINKKIVKQNIKQNIKQKSKEEIIKNLYTQAKIDTNNLNYNESIEKYKKIIELKPNECNNYLKELGEIYEKKNMFKDAIQCYNQILKIEVTDIPTIGVITNQLGTCYFNLNEFKLAIEYFKRVLQIKEIPDVYNNIGICYINLKDYKEAELNLLKSYKIDGNISSISSLGQIYYYMKKYEKSLEYYSKNLKNTNNIQLYNSSFPYLAKKDFKKGFKLYEERLKINNINRQTKEKERIEIPNLKYWNGVDECNKLLLVSEQGIGDNIMFYRFIIELSEKYPNMKITFFCKREIVHIFKTYNNIEIIDRLCLFNYDYMLFIMSLPYILNLTTIVPNKINYINTSKEKLQFWKNKTSSLKKFKVGFVYNGLLISFIDKYIPLEEYKLLTDLDIELICIHKKDDVEKELTNISFSNKITYYDIDNDKPFEDTIHLLQNIDLLITIDTYIVHLAGILNVKTWLLLGTSEWRWSDDISKTYWYNSVELIRTKGNESLKDLIKVVKKKLLQIL
jgi:tetratricopeptide (TPR) repeat protein